jgi:signal transduction histidine kinase
MTPDKMTPDQLRELFLFEALSDEQLQWLAERGDVVRAGAGGTICAEGEPATCFYVLLCGVMTMNRLIHGDDIETVRTDQRGAYGGATQAYMGDKIAQVYNHSLRAVTDVEVYALPAEEFAAAMLRWFPMAMHMLEGLFLGMRASQTLIGERERLLALGALSAGLTHELNNPAAAAVRATAVLRDRVAGMRHKLALIADGRLDGRQLARLVELQETAVKRAASAPTDRSAMQISDAEDALGGWLDARGCVAPWDIAATLVAGGIDVDWVREVEAAVEQADFEAAVRWITYTVETELLMGEIEDAVSRVSSLVGAAKQYSQLDRAPHQVVDVHDLLHATLVILKGKIPPGVKVVKHWDKSLPPIPAYAAELNQVWTNLIDNALGAMQGHGTLTITTVRDGDLVCVEIADTGPGIPADVRPRIFEPFFTTKPVGEGTGLGLDISYRIVVNKHHGDIRVISSPGDTRFRVLLPIEAGATFAG